MTAIKVFHRPEDLREQLVGLGWQTRVERVGNGLFWGEAQRP